VKPISVQMLVEEYIPGREVAVEGLLTDGSLRILAISDKPDPLEGPYFEETIYVTPSRLPASQQRAIEQCADNAVRALGLSHGPIHAEFRVDEGKVWPLEVAAASDRRALRAWRFGSREKAPALRLAWKSCSFATLSICPAAACLANHLPQG